jgi:hypothetical protein
MIIGGSKINLKDKSLYSHPAQNNLADIMQNLPSFSTINVNKHKKYD